MKISLDDVDLAVVVNVDIFREVLKKMSVVNGRRWWIACEPAYALDTGYITVGYGDPHCSDRLNTVLYRVPILNIDWPPGGPDKLVVLLDSSVVVADQPGLYRGDDGVGPDEVADFEDFFVPILRALVPVLADYVGAKKIQ
jgi:hypothetical protein